MRPTGALTTGFGAPNVPEPASLLHNMSAPPKSVIAYAGLGQTADDPATGTGASHAAIRFSLGNLVMARSAAGLLRHLGLVPGPNPGAELERLIDARAAVLPLPSGCAVLPGRAAPDARVIWPDLLSSLAVLAKCSDNVWLRAKTPSITAALARRHVTLLVPAGLRDRLPPEDR